MLSELVEATRESWANEDTGSVAGRFMGAMNQVTTRLKTVNAQDIASIVGIDRSFSEREIKLGQALLQGKALAHHMEDECKLTCGLQWIFFSDWQLAHPIIFVLLQTTVAWAALAASVQPSEKISWKWKRRNMFVEARVS